MSYIFKQNFYKTNKFFLVFCIAFLTACVSDPRMAKLEDSKVKPENVIDLIDSEVFDYKLGLSLTKNIERVEINIISPFNSNKIPERIEKWLSAVDVNGGEIILKENAKQRGIISEVVDLVIITYEAIKKNILYAATENYNAEVFYDGQTGEITKRF